MKNDPSRRGNAAAKLSIGVEYFFGVADTSAREMTIAQALPCLKAKRRCAESSTKFAIPRENLSS